MYPKAAAVPPIAGSGIMRPSEPSFTKTAMSDLFTRQPDAPLAERLRPHTLDDVIGQQHLIGEGKPLRVAVEGGKPHSMLLWGPPGVGKTTLARILAQSFNAQFLPVSAVFSGVKDIREAIDKAEIA